MSKSASTDIPSTAASNKELTILQRGFTNLYYQQLQTTEALQWQVRRFKRITLELTVLVILLVIWFLFKNATIYGRNRMMVDTIDKAKSMGLFDYSGMQVAWACEVPLTRYFWFPAEFAYAVQAAYYTNGINPEYIGDGMSFLNPMLTYAKDNEGKVTAKDIVCTVLKVPGDQQGLCAQPCDVNSSQASTNVGSDFASKVAGWTATGAMVGAVGGGIGSLIGGTVGTLIGVGIAYANYSSQTNSCQTARQNCVVPDGTPACGSPT